MGYELLPLLQEKIESITIFDYASIPHSEVVERALTNKKPFLEGEKGYRDTLIWISFLNHIAECTKENDEVIFITENKSDFFKIKDKIVSFHKDLKDDIQEKGIKTKINAFTSLFNFVNSTIEALVIVLAKKANTRLNETRNLGRRRSFLGRSAG